MSTAPSRPSQAVDARQRGERRTLRRVLLIGPLLALLIWCLLPNAGPVFRLFNIPSTSMAPTLQIGQMFVVSRASYGYSRHSFDLFELPITGRVPALMPAQGDVVALRSPSDLHTFYIKRVIGLPGDRVALKDGRLVINGTVVARDPAGGVADPLGEKDNIPAYVEHLPGGASYTILEAEGDTGMLDTFAEVEVPAGDLFVMGDNRDNSSDSRLSGAMGLGFVPVELVLGRVLGVK